MPNTAQTTRLSRSPFWVFSFVLHTVLLGGLIWYGPVRDIIIEHGRPKRQTMIRGKELEKVIERMQKSVADELAERVALLKEGQNRMATNFQTLNTHFQPYEQNQKATARLRFEKYATSLQSDQQALLKLLEEVKANCQFTQAAQAGQDKMPRMISALDEVRRGVLLMTTDEAIAQAHTQAQTALFDVDVQLRQIGSTLGREIQLQNASQNAREQMSQYKPIMDASKAEYQRLKKADELLEKQCNELKKKIDVLRKAKSKNRELLKQAIDQYRDLTKQRQAARKPLSDALRKAKNDQKRYDYQKHRLESVVDKLNKMDVQHQLPQLLDKAIGGLNEAMMLESKVIKQVRQTVKQGAEVAS